MPLDTNLINDPLNIDVQLIIQRHQFKIRALAEQEQLSGQILAPLPELRIRKAKKDWLEGRFEQAGLQIQQQQQQQQQQQIPMIHRQQRRPKSLIAAAPSSDVPVFLAELGPLINHHNIESKLGQYASLVFPKRRQSLDLRALWHHLVGKDAEKITDKKRTITHVQIKAMQKIIRYYPEFSYGIVPDNLPKGFYLQWTADQHHVLCYSEHPAHQQKQVNSLTIGLKKPQQKPNLGTYKQFLIALAEDILFEDEDAIKALHMQLQTLPQDSMCERNFYLIISDRPLANGVRKDAFLFFITKLTQKNPELQQLLFALITSFSDFHDLPYKALANILIHQGEYGVLRFLEQMKTLKNKGFYNQFIKLFLNDPQQLLSDVGLQNLKKLSKLDENQKTWWESLVEQHSKSGNIIDFNELFEAFDYFLKSLNKIGLNILPSSCPLEPISHMKVALDRALRILMNANDRNEQLTCLQDLDFSNNGAYLASHFDEFAIVSKEMLLTPSSEDTLAYAPPPYEYTFFTIAPEGLRPEDYETVAIRHYYRFIAKQERPFPIHIYQTIEDIVKSKENFSPEEKACFLAVVALSTAGKNNTCSDPIKDATNLLAVISVMDHSYKSIHQESFVKKLSKINEISSDQMIALSDLVKIVEFLSSLPDQTENDKKNLEHTVWSTLKLTASFSHQPERALTILDLLRKRSNAAKVQGTFIQYHLDHPQTIDGLVALSLWLKQDERNLLQDLKADETARDHFTALFSLVNDPIDLRNPECIEQVVIPLALHFNTLPLQTRDLLLSMLNKIDMNDSTHLPSIAQIDLFIDSILQNHALMALPEPQKEVALLNKLGEQFPNTSFGHTPITESILHLIGVFRTFYEVNKPAEMIAEILKPGGLIEQQIGKGNILNSLERISYETRKANERLTMLLLQKPDEMSEELILQALLEVEQKLDILARSEIHVRWGINLRIDGPIIKPALIYIAGQKTAELNGEETRERVKTKLANYFKTRKILPWLKDALEDVLLTNLNESVHSLKTKNPQLNQFFLDQLGHLDVSKSIDQALKEYSQCFHHIKECINALIRINNQDVDKKPEIAEYKDYRKCIAVLVADNLTPLKYLSSEQINLIFKAIKRIDFLHLPTPEYLRVSEQLKIIFEIINENTPFQPMQLTNALTQIKVLTQLKDQSTPDAYKLLLKVSFTHNFTCASGHFPIEALAEMMTMDSIDKQAANELFNNLVQVIETIKEDVNDELLAQIITNVVYNLKHLSHSNPQVIVLLSNTLKRCRSANAYEMTALHSFLHMIPSVPPHLRTDWLNIMMHLSANSNGEEVIVSLVELTSKLKNHHTLLPEIAELFASPPHPTLASLNNNLSQNKMRVSTYIKEFDRDPKSKRKDVLDGSTGHILKNAAKILDEHFDITHIHPVVTKVTDLLTHSNLDISQQFDLVQQLIYINAIGKDHPVNFGDGKICKNLSKISRATLSEYFNLLKKALSEPGLSKDKLKSIQLNLLAILREAYFRCTGKFPYSTQMLSLLLSLNYPDNLFLEINTGEGKSVTTALLATLQWTKGNTNVDVCTATRDLVFQDYTCKGTQDFFRYLGIPSAMIPPDAPKGTYVVGGINYSTTADLANYRSRAKLEGELLVTNNEMTTNVILDECDYTTLDDRTLFNFAIPAAGSQNSHHNPFAHLYPLINQFINEDENFKHLAIQEGQVWTQKEDVRQLRIYLDRHLPFEQRMQLMSIPEKKFDKWLNAACAAHQQVEGKHFIIVPEKRIIDDEEREVSIAMPLIKNIPQPGAILSDGVQQFLHARLQTENQRMQNNRLFPIDAEMLSIASQSAKDFLDYYHDNGRIIGLSGTVGAAAELLEQQSKFGIKAIKVPPHEENKRQCLYERVSQSDLAQEKEIIKAIRESIQPEKTQPILIICKDIIHARSLAHHITNASHKKNRTLTLDNTSFTVNLITDSATESEHQHFVEKAGHPNTITIATSRLGRGTDIDPQHENGLFVIQCYLDTERNTQQILGRSARNGQIGKYLAIYDENGLPHRQELGSLMKLSASECHETIERMQQRMNKEGAIERHYIQEYSGIRSILVNQFDDWKALIELTADSADLKKLKSDLCFLREELLSNLSEQWYLEIESSNPNGEYPNPFIRSINNVSPAHADEYETSALDRALANFEKRALACWEETRIHLYKTVKISELSTINQFRFELLKLVDASEQLKLRKIVLREDQQTVKKEQKYSAYHTQHAIDVEAAVLKFSDVLNPHEKINYQKRSTRTQLRLLQSTFNHFVDKTAMDNELKQQLKIKDNLIQEQQAWKSLFSVGTAFQQAEIYMEKAQLQPLIVEFLNIFEQTASCVSAENPVPAHLLTMREELKSQFIENMSQQIADNLERHLCWAHEKNQSWYYWIETSEVKEAAVRLLQASAELKQAQSPEEKAEKLKALYRVLQQESIRLEGMGILHRILSFLFGYTNTKKLIDNTLKTLDNIGTSLDLPTVLQKEIHEQSVGEFYLDKFNPILQEIAEIIPQRFLHPWTILTTELDTIQQNNHSLYVFDELAVCLERYKTKAHHPALLKPIQFLLHHLYDAMNVIKQKYRTVLGSSQFLFSTQEKFKTLFTQIDGVAIEQLCLTTGHTGVTEFYELSIRCKGTGHPLFNAFTQYTDRRAILERELNCLLTERALYQAKQAHFMYITQQHELMTNYEKFNPMALQQMPLSFKTLLEKNSLEDTQGFIERAFELPIEIQKQLSIFETNRHLLENQSALRESAEMDNSLYQYSDKVAQLLQQYKALQSLEFTHQMDEQTSSKCPPNVRSFLQTFIEKKAPYIKELADLDNEERNLKQKLAEINENKKNPSIIEKALGIVNTNSITKALGHVLTKKQLATDEINKIIANFYDTLIKSLKEINNEIKSSIQSDLHFNLQALQRHLIKENKEIQNTLDEIEEKIVLLENEIHIETAKSGVVMKRFYNINDLFAFHTLMRAAITSQSPSAPIKAPEGPTFFRKQTILNDEVKESAASDMAISDVVQAYSEPHNVPSILL